MFNTQSAVPIPLPKPSRVAASQSSFTGGSILLYLSPFLLYVYPVVAGFITKSLVPLVLGRYSMFLAAFNAWNLVLLTLFVTALAKKSGRLIELSCLLLILSTLIVPANNALQNLPALMVVLPLTRLCAALAMFAVEFDFFRRTRQICGGLILLSSVFFVLSILDGALLGIVAFKSPTRIGSRADAGFRDSYNLVDVGPNDVIVVGDSFVWGQGVEIEERFGNRLESLYAKDAPPRRVWSLGVIGGDVKEYGRSLSLVPAGRRANLTVLAFYLNDLPPVLSARDKVQSVLGALGRGCPTLGLIGDMLAKLLVRDVDGYHQYVVACYDKSESTYAARWALLGEQMKEFRDLAAARAETKPVFLLIPLMVDFQDYPLEEAHGDLQRLAEELGFEVVDLLPVFRARLGDGSKYRVAPNNNHFGAFVHELVGRELHSRLELPAAQ